MGRKASKDYFKRTADITHRFNNQVKPQRGGYRL